MQSILPAVFSFHLIGLIFWIGPLLVLTRYLKVASEEGTRSELNRRFVKVTFLGFVLAGVALVIVTGMIQLIGYKGMAFYMKAGWFHTKLTFVIILLVMTGAVGLEVRKFLEGEAVAAKRLSAYHGVVSLSVIVAIFLTMYGRW